MLELLVCHSMEQSARRPTHPGVEIEVSVVSPIHDSATDSIAPSEIPPTIDSTDRTTTIDQASERSRNQPETPVNPELRSQQLPGINRAAEYFKTQISVAVTPTLDYAHSLVLLFGKDAKTGDYASGTTAQPGPESSNHDIINTSSQSGAKIYRVRWAIDASHEMIFHWSSCLNLIFCVHYVQL